MKLPRLSEYTKLRNDANYSYLRWLMLVATGAFTLTAGVAFGKLFLDYQLLSIKVALSMNAIGILFGAISAHGEARLAQGILEKVCDKEKYILLEDYEAASGVMLAYRLPWLYIISEWIFYLALCISLLAWVAFIWLG